MNSERFSAGVLEFLASNRHLPREFYGRHSASRPVSVSADELAHEMELLGRGNAHPRARALLY